MNRSIRRLIAAASLGVAVGCSAGSILSGKDPAALTAGTSPSPHTIASPPPISAVSSAPAGGGTDAAERHDSILTKLLGPNQTRLSAEERGGIINILLIGTDETLPDSDDPGRGDVTMLCSLNRDTGAVKLVSFERSTAVPWPGHGDVMLTNSFTYGGAALTTDSVRNCFRVDIAGYIHFDFDSFRQVIDTLGGIDVELTAEEAAALTEDTYTQVWFSEGVNHLDGDGALRYCRLRRIDDNWQRIARQRAAVQAVITKTRTLRLSQISELAEKLLPVIDTDLSPRQLASLLLSAPKFAGAHAEQLTVPDRDNIWMYDGYDKSVTGCSYGTESARLREFLYESDTDSADDTLE